MSHRGRIAWFRGLWRGDGGFESINDLGRKNGAGNGADGFAAVVGKAPLLLVGEGLELVEGFGGQERG